MDKLSGRENYNDWSFALQACFEHGDPWSCFLGEDKTTDEDEKSRRATKAKSKIVMSVDPSNYIHIRQATNATELWDKLKNAFQDSGLTRR
ncbi:hypothetical protein Trydic_g12326 [Trypoxylus dichotomus]